ncbi:tetratricopeptide repeat protein [Stakelama saccharophila]|uniref:Tetratricopeptide repeat protein n=1 Tax=Stakelama saccharophila TaxID=3075605 RepID=A0ABZ0BF19_9SPHN|nr:hypothetical protein [Stakelama sp. W311]WNO55059.1 hypothetical protein RPR59_07390 [Stakelama sp. W311]
MKFASKAALAVALATGMALPVIATPADAAVKQDKDEQKEAPLQVGKEFREAAVAAQTALQSGDTATAKTQIQTAASLAKTPDEKYFLASLQLPLAARENDEAMMKTALDALLASDRVQQADRAKYNFYRAQIALNEDDNAAAITYLNKSKQLGYSNPEMPLMLARAQIDSGQIQPGLQSLDEAIAAEKAAGKEVPESQYKFGWSQAYKAKDMAAATKWLMRWIDAYPTAENWRQGLVVYRDAISPSAGGLDKPARLDFFRLMRASDALAGDSDYTEYADLTNRMGLPYETIAVIDQGRADGKISSSSSALNQLYTEAKGAVKNDKSLDALRKEAMASAKGNLAAQTADAYLADGQPATAVELYNTALQKGGVEADVINTRLGIAYAKAGQTAQAEQAFAKVNGTGVRGDIADLWELWLDNRSGAAAGAGTMAGASATTGTTAATQPTGN